MVFPQRLIDGFSAFAGDRLQSEQARYRALAERGQSPEIMVIGCCDSRVSPEIIFDARPGELFVARNIANLVPPYTPDGAQRAVSAALEYAVEALKVKHIVVLGHAQCGGIRAFAEEAEPLSPGDFIGHWMALIAPTAKAIGGRGSEPFDQYLTRLEQASMVQTLENLMTFPWVRRRVEAGALALHAAYFGVATGRLSIWDESRRQFAPLATQDLRQPQF